VRVVSTYISRELCKIVALCLGAFLAMYLIIDFFERIDNFLEAHLSLSTAGLYFLLKLPLILQQGIPVSVLMGTLITLGLLVRNNELMALKAGGLSPISYITPIVTVALVLSLADLALAEYLVPFTSSRANLIWNVQVNHRSLESGFSQERIWYKSGRVLYNIRVLHPRRQLLEGVTIYFFDKDFRLTKRLDARRAEWDGKDWTFVDGIVLTRHPDGTFVMDQFKELPLRLAERPQDFQHLQKAPEEMTLAELHRYVEKIQSEGYDATRYRVDFNAKIAFPFTPLIMSLMGIGVALYQGRRGGIALGVAASIALASVYLLVFQFVLSVGYAGTLQPFVAAWIPNVFFGLAGLLLLAHSMH
jgi:lipopolysaccharide export system permease protein